MNDGNSALWALSEGKGKWVLTLLLPHLRHIETISLHAGQPLAFVKQENYARMDHFPGRLEGRHSSPAVVRA